ncbi:MAG: recombination regulator RecX [Candidatus Nanopelagicales bacterium]|nr:recombination regulator RecX [Candidatus Nanopelagicales bacterium]
MTSGDPDSDPYEVARLIALQQLDVKPRTVAEIHHTLLSRGIPVEVADHLVERFREVGLLDDRVYAQLWVESRMRSRGLGAMALRQELRRHKVPDDVIEETLAGIDGEDALQAAVEQVRPRVARCELPLSNRDRQRLLGFLMRRGHSPSVASRALEVVQEEIGEEEGS